MDEAVQWAVRQHIPFDLERVYLDWQELIVSPRLAGRREVLVGAAQKDVVDPLLQALDGVNLQVAALELEAQAIVRSLLPLDAQDVFGVLIIDLGATYTNVVFFDGGAMRFTTSIQFGGDDLTQRLAESLHLQPSIAAEKKAIVGLKRQSGEDADFSLVLRQATVELFREVEKTVRELTIQIRAGQPVQAILLSGGSANLPGIKDVVAEVFPGIPVQMGNPWTNVYSVGEQEQRSPLSPQDANHFVTAIGLALRST
jgi:type IV pilus assembly protein PilM